MTSQTQANAAATGKVKLLVVLLVILVVGGAGEWAYLRHQARLRMQAALAAGTRTDLQRVLDAMKTYLEVKERLPFKIATKDDAFTVEAKEVFGRLYDTNTIVELQIPQPPDAWVRAGSLLDRWGGNINLRVLPKAKEDPDEEIDRYTITLWSSGPNGNNDAGQIDDVALDPFQAVVWKSKAAAPVPKAPAAPKK